MHPELFMLVYRIQERERDQRLRHRLAAQERVFAMTVDRREPVERPLGRVQQWQELFGLGADAAPCCAMA